MSVIPNQRGFDGRPELRENMHELCGFLRLYAENAQNFAEAADDIGLGYSIAKAVAYAKAMDDLGQLLREECDRLRKQRALERTS
jgi:hypothetical protein